MKVAGGLLSFTGVNDYGGKSKSEVSTITVSSHTHSEVISPQWATNWLAAFRNL